MLKIYFLRYWYVVVAVIFLLCCIVWFTFDYVIGYRASKQAVPGLHKVFSTIDIPPETKLIKQGPSYKPHSPAYEGFYNTRMNYQQIREFYISILTPNGWVTTEEVLVKDWGRDKGFRQIVFSKEKHVIVIEWTAAREQYGFDYSLTISMMN